MSRYLDLRRETADGVRVLYDLERQRLELLDGRLVGRCSQRVALLVLGEACLRDAVDMHALLAGACEAVRLGTTDPGDVRRLASLLTPRGAPVTALPGRTAPR